MEQTAYRVSDAPVRVVDCTPQPALDVWRTPEEVLSYFDDGSDLMWVDAENDPERRISVVGWGTRTLRAFASRDGEVSTALSVLDTRHEVPAPLGWYGWLGYGVAAAVLDLPDEVSDRIAGDDDTPDLSFLWVDRALVFDHRRHTVTIRAGHEHDAWRRRIESWFETSSPGYDPVRAAPVRSDALWADSDDGYIDLVERCREFISAGEVFQLCLTTTATIDGVGDDVNTYRRLRATSPAPHGMFARISGTSVLCSSPEQFVRIDASRHITSSPIKGTRPRSDNPRRDRALADELRASDKEQAENVMIVDLVRNDLNRVCTNGSVRVTGLFQVKSYPQVHQLVSTVVGTIRPDVSSVSAICSCLPAGSMTGAPKHRAVELLSALESRARGVYAGAMGWIGPDGQADLAVVIRTIVIANGQARIGVGGGVTILSDPAFELAEVKLKSRALLAALGSR